MNIETRRAGTAAAMRYREANGGVLSNRAVTVLAETFGVSRPTVRRWVRQALEDSGGGPRPALAPGRDRRPAFEFGPEHAVAVRQNRSLKRAHRQLWSSPQAAGYVSYPTFVRAFNRLGAALQAGLLGGADDMAAAQVYLSTRSPHVNHTWYIDHKQAHVWVALPRGRIAKPWVTTVRDGATGAWLASVAYQGRPNEDSICDALATAAQGRRYEIDGEPVDLGGVPTQLVLDNAAEHFSEAVVRGSVLLGTVIAPTRAYEKQQNGTAESANSVIAEMEKSLPGFAHAKSARLAAPITTEVPGDVDLDNLISFERYQRELDQLVERMNTKPVRALGHRSRLQAWRDDPTERSAIAPESFRLMLRRETRPRPVHAEGIRFRDRDYVAPELGHYRKRGILLTIGYLSREERFIDVFDDRGEWICRAWDRELLTEGQRFQILQARQRDRQLLAEIDAIAKEEVRHQHHLSYDAEVEKANLLVTPTTSRPVANVTPLRGHVDAAEPGADGDESRETVDPGHDAASREHPGVSPRLSRVDPTTARSLRRSRSKMGRVKSDECLTRDQIEQEERMHQAVMARRERRAHRDQLIRADEQIAGSEEARTSGGDRS